MLDRRVPDLNRVIAMGCICGLLSACGPAGAQSSSAPTSTTIPPIAAATTATPAPTSVSPTPIAVTSPTASVTATPVAGTSNSAAAATTLVLDPSASKASYHAQEQLVGRNLPSEAVGTTGSVSGSIVFAGDGSIVADQSQISVDLRQLKSDESRRDNFIQGNTLETSHYPTATFVPTTVSGLPNPIPTSGAASFQLSGDLTVHGVAKPVTWQVNAQFDNAGVSGTAITQVNISDFGMTPPKAGPVLSLQDGVTLELDFQASRQV